MAGSIPVTRGFKAPERAYRSIGIFRQNRGQRKQIAPGGAYFSELSAPLRLSRRGIGGTLIYVAN